MAKIHVDLPPPLGRVGWLGGLVVACFLLVLNSWLLKVSFPLLEKMLPKAMQQVHAEQAVLLLLPLLGVALELQLVLYFLQRLRIWHNRSDS